MVYTFAYKSYKESICARTEAEAREKLAKDCPWLAFAVCEVSKDFAYDITEEYKSIKRKWEKNFPWAGLFEDNARDSGSCAARYLREKLTGIIILTDGCILLASTEPKIIYLRSKV